MRRIFYLMFFVFSLSACNMPKPDSKPADALMRTVVAATLQALTAQPVSPQATPELPAPAPILSPQVTETPAFTPTASTGKVSGKVCYHDAGMLELTVYFQNTADQKLWTKSVSRPNDTYSLEIPAGKYKVYAWPPDYTVGVLVKDKPTVDVAPSQTLSGVDLCDYSQGPFAAPYPPGVSPSNARGSVSGSISGYGGGNRLTVVAFNKGTGYWYYVILLAGESYYSISDLPAGRYQVVAYDGFGAAGGTQPTIYVIAGQNATADISAWGGEYPANPVH
jgi:hypothetical protein